MGRRSGGPDRRAADFLTQLDAAIGDADHGVNMQRGFTAAVATLQSSSDRSPGSLLEEVGKTLIYRVGGAAGPLYGTGFRQIGVTVSEAVTPDGEVLLPRFVPASRGYRR